MEITYLGHSSFRIKTKNTSLITDPYDSNMVGLKYPDVSGDIVTISHDHVDHNFINLVKDTKRVIFGPGEYEVMGISLIGIPSFHDDKKGGERGKNTIYLIEAEDLRLVHLGDLGHELSDDVVETLGDVDILFVPVGGFYTIGSNVATDLVRNIEPKITIPMHYFTDGMVSENFGKLSKVDTFLSEVGMPVEKMDKLSIKRSDFSEGENAKVVLLESKAAPVVRK